MFGLDCDRPDVCPEAELKYYIDDFLLLLPYVQAVAFEFSDIAWKPAPEPKSLTVQECDLLRWSLDGHSSVELAKKTHTSQATIEFKLHRIMEKLSCSTRYEAILKALRVGAITCE
jgi:DNA-binding CsgD family transcriptional regulator